MSQPVLCLIAHAMSLRRDSSITPKKTKLLKTKMKKLLGETLTHLDEEFESFKKGILKVEDYLFTFLSDPRVPYDNNASERGVRKIKIKTESQWMFPHRQRCRRFCQTAFHSGNCPMKNGNSKFNAILAVVKQ